jgi:hypothetical protein
MFNTKPSVWQAVAITTKRFQTRWICGATPAIAFLAMLVLCSLCRAQESPGQQAPAPTQPTAPTTPTELPPIPPDLSGQVVQNPNAPCLQPPPPVTYRDYQGPFAKTVSVFAQRLERKSVGGTPATRHYKPGVLLCTLEVKDKFWLFVRDSTDPVAFLNAGYDAVIGQWQDDQPSFGTGPRGFGDRFGTTLAGQASAGFFKDLVYPTIFSEDPRYYRLGAGPTHTRVFHALSHVVIAHNENGNRMFNFSEWLGDASVVVLSNTYLPDNRRGVEPVATSMANTIGFNMGWDVLREYWPEVAKEFHLPFRDQNPPVIQTAATN